MDYKIYKFLDIKIFTLLKIQALDDFVFLLDMRKLATVKGLQNDVERINISIAESRQMLLLANHQLSDLQGLGTNKRMGFFDTIKPF